MGNTCSCSCRRAASSLLLPYVTVGSDRRSLWATPAGAQSFVLPTHLAVYHSSRLISNATSGCSVCTKEKTRMNEALALRGGGNSWEARLLPHRWTWVGLFTLQNEISSPGQHRRTPGTRYSTSITSWEVWMGYCLGICFQKAETACRGVYSCSPITKQA